MNSDHFVCSSILRESFRGLRLKISKMNLLTEILLLGSPPTVFPLLTVPRLLPQRLYPLAVEWQAVLRYAPLGN